jgi:hypothetical protein
MLQFENEMESAGKLIDDELIENESQNFEKD